MSLINSIPRIFYDKKMMVDIEQISAIENRIFFSILRIFIYLNPIDSTVQVIERRVFLEKFVTSENLSQHIDFNFFIKMVFDKMLKDKIGILTET